MAHILGGRPVVEAMTQDIKARVGFLREKGIIPTLALVRIGSQPEDLSYERSTLKKAADLNIATHVFEFPEDVTEQELANQINRMNADESIHGVLMFRPLPEFINEKALCDLLAVTKDVDGISSTALGGIFLNDEDVLPPCTAEACIKLLDHYDISVSGKHIVVIGRSMVIGKPISMLLLNRNASVSICHSYTANTADLTRMADIVICATGRPKAYGAEFFSPGQTVLDVGINFENGKMCGDVDFDDAIAVLGEEGNITPVPGGIGSITTMCTMEHTVRAAEMAQ